MKYLLILSFIYLSINSQGQDIDSLKQQILKLDQAVHNIDLNMRKSHKEFSSGSILVLAGIVMSAVYVYGRERQSGAEKPALLYIGVGLTTVGVCIQIDSHKYFGSGKL